MVTIELAVINDRVVCFNHAKAQRALAAERKRWLSPGAALGRLATANNRTPAEELDLLVSREARKELTDALAIFDNYVGSDGKASSTAGKVDKAGRPLSLVFVHISKLINSRFGLTPEQIKARKTGKQLRELIDRAVLLEIAQTERLLARKLREWMQQSLPRSEIKARIKHLVGLRADAAKASLAD